MAYTVSARTFSAEPARRQLAGILRNVPEKHRFLLSDYSFQAHFRYLQLIPHFSNALPIRFSQSFGTVAAVAGHAVSVWDVLMDCRSLGSLYSGFLAWRFGDRRSYLYSFIGA